MPLSANLLKLESSILPRAKRATNRNNVATEQRVKKKFLAPNSPGAEMYGAEVSGAKVSSAETAVPNRRHRIVPDPLLHTFTNMLVKKFLGNNIVHRFSYVFLTIMRKDACRASAVEGYEGALVLWYYLLHSEAMMLFYVRFLLYFLRGIRWNLQI